MGGYCRMKGEEEFRQALSAKLDSFTPSAGSLFYASPLKRVATFLAGPVFTFLLAVMLFTGVWWIGYSYQTYENRIIITSDYPDIYGSEDLSPAAQAGLQTGDYIRSIQGEPVETFSDLQQIISAQPEISLEITAVRDGNVLSITAVPRINRSTGTGYLGVGPYIEPVISHVQPDGSAASAGLKPGDRITAVDSTPVNHSIELYRAFASTPGSSELKVQRGQSTITMTYIPRYNQQGLLQPDFSFQLVERQTPDYNFFQAIGPGIAESFETFVLTIKGIGMLFSGSVDTSDAVAGPLRITYLMGDITSQGFSAGFRQGIITLFRLIGFISIALTFANLLPIPALDGGQILISLYEAIRGKMISPRKYYILQMIGFSLIMFIFLLTLMNDISFFARGG